ncbi:hypothetical protein L249_2925, partial [Ophiocordyceps polyrhachis-furcata BCC 54312]
LALGGSFRGDTDGARRDSRFGGADLRESSEEGNQNSNRFHSLDSKLASIDSLDPGRRGRDQPVKELWNKTPCFYRFSPSDLPSFTTIDSLPFSTLASLSPPVTNDNSPPLRPCKFRPDGTQIFTRRPKRALGLDLFAALPLPRTDGLQIIHLLLDFSTTLCFRGPSVTYTSILGLADLQTLLSASSELCHFTLGLVRALPSSLPPANPLTCLLRALL